MYFLRLYLFNIPSTDLFGYKFCKIKEKTFAFCKNVKFYYNLVFEDATKCAADKTLATNINKKGSYIHYGIRLGGDRYAKSGQVARFLSVS